MKNPRSEILLAERNAAVQLPFQYHSTKTYADFLDDTLFLLRVYDIPHPGMARLQLIINCAFQAGDLYFAATLRNPEPEEIVEFIETFITDAVISRSDARNA